VSATPATPKPRRLVARVAGWLDRRFALHSRANLLGATIAVMALCGVASLGLGQDTNWDLRNYHHYNGYAFLHDRLHIDLAPAQMQTYFAPILDLAQYLMLRHWPAALVGLVLGALHGLLFLPLAGVAWEVLREHSRRAQLAPLLALAGLCSAAFLSELGNTMADNTTALLVVSALWGLLRAQRRQAQGLSAGWLLAMAGILLGCALALKLTNAIYAIGLGVAALAAGSARQRAGNAVMLASLAAAACLMIAGPWWWTLWRTFGNPLFPQFNAWFQGPLALPISIADLRWMPRDWKEHLLWPVVFTLDPGRVSEVSLRQLSWATLYVTGLALLVKWMVAGRWRAVCAARPMPLACFFVASYLVWQLVFSIHRYLVVLELLAPLLLWCGLRTLAPGRRGARLGLAVVGACAAVALLGSRDWGHAPWARQAFSVEGPPMPDPGNSLVLLVGAEPQSWRIPQLPAQAAYAGVGSNFPEASAYRARLAGMASERPHLFAMLPASGDRRRLKAERVNGWAVRLGLTGPLGCRVLRHVAGKRDGIAVARDVHGRCRLEVPAEQAGAGERNAQLAAQAAALLPRYGLRLETASCVALDARIGRTPFPYQWCTVVVDAMKPGS
jgi:hypothetical protein